MELLAKLLAGLVLVGPPLMALLYALNAVVFSSMWGEGETNDLPMLLTGTLLTRGAWLLVTGAVLMTMGTSSNSTIYESRWSTWLLLALLNIWVSGHWIWETRQQIIVGGPPPPIIERIMTKSDNKNKTDTPVLFQGRVAVVTGANTGIGLETARFLYQGGATVILACRDTTKGQRARQAILNHPAAGSASPQVLLGVEDQNRCRVVALDLTSFASVREAARTILQMSPTVDLLINNAGVMMPRQVFTPQDGLDTVLQANHLGHYLLTRLLLPALLNSSAPVVIQVSSSTYRLADGLHLDDWPVGPQDPVPPRHAPYYLFQQYGVTKLANLVFAQELARRYPTVYSAALHPGIVRTEVTRYMPWYLYYPDQVLGGYVATLQKTPAQGAWCTLHVSDVGLRFARPDHQDELPPSGSYWCNRKVQKVQSQIDTSDPQHGRALWKVSAELVGLPPDG